MQTRARWIPRLSPFVPWIVALASAAPAWARIGGGESFDSGRSDSGGDGGDFGFLLDLLVWLLIHHPRVGIPLILVCVVGYLLWQRTQGSDASTRKALDRAEAARRTTVSAEAVTRWVDALKARDPAFEQLPFLDRVGREFLSLQEAWFRRDLEPVRRHLSDATSQRLVTQLRLLEVQGVRDAIAEPRVLDLAIIGLEQSDAFDMLHVRVKAQLRDDDVPAHFTDEQARAQAMTKAPEPFTEVWTFARKPGAQTKAGGEASQGACPNCGAPFDGGAANTCGYCGAIVNSGTYDWVLAEITQGSEYSATHETADGVARTRQTDPAFTTEALEDRAALLFWRWVEAQVLAEPGRLAKVAAPGFFQGVEREVAQLRERGQRRYFLECAVGAVSTRSITQLDGFDVAAVEVRWSSRSAVGPTAQRPAAPPSRPQRTVLLLQRLAGAQTPAGTGLATNRCPTCHAPLTDNGQPSCEFCGTALASGERDWVLRDLGSWEWWLAQGGRAPSSRPTPVAARVPDREERERLLYLMAAMARADGAVDAQERRLLRMAAERWSIPWANVELALSAGDGLFDRLIVKGSVEAESFLRELVQVALVDGRIDGRERKLLAAAAEHLGLGGRLAEFLKP